MRNNNAGKFSLADVLVVCLLLATLHITVDQDVGAAIASLKASVNAGDDKSIEAFSKFTLPLALGAVDTTLVPELEALGKENKEAVCTKIGIENNGAWCSSAWRSSAQGG